ncbi:MAG TPA: MFS transporter [Nitrospiraceae bacterium]|nr:MFS transporter [Nitrospiraceae bacterium]
MTSPRNLLFFFGLAYFSQGLAGTLIQQPLAYHLKSHGMAAHHVAQALAFVAIPWIVKPLYGLISDSIPLFGYRRKSYLVLATSLSTFGYLAMSQLAAPHAILTVLLVTTLGIAAMDVLVDALMVEEGQKTGLIGQFQGQQWTWLNIASITAAALGGWLIEVSTPAGAVQWAVLIIAFAPLAVLTSTLRLIEEPRVVITEPLLVSMSHHLMMAITSKRVWIMAGFLAFWNLIPNFSLPLYYHMTDQLQFGQGFIGQLHAIGAAAAAAGAYAYRKYLAEAIPLRLLLVLSIALSAATAFSYVLLSGQTSARLLHIVSGVVSMIALLTFFSLAASVCRAEAAAFTFALLMAIYSIAGQVSAVASAYLYQEIFRQNITLLILTAGCFTLLALLWIPILPVDQPKAFARAA